MISISFPLVVLLDQHVGADGVVLQGLLAYRAQLLVHAQVVGPGRRIHEGALVAWLGFG